MLVDNAAYSYAFQMENGVPIIPYYHGSKDFELKMLQSFLEPMEICKDVRSVNRSTFRLNRYRDYKHQEVEKLIEDLYINKIDWLLSQQNYVPMLATNFCKFLPALLLGLWNWLNIKLKLINLVSENLNVFSDRDII